MARRLRVRSLTPYDEEPEMSTESAIAYIRRMRDDAEFRQIMNGFDGDDAGWDYLRTQGFEFSMSEFKLAQQDIYKEYGVTPM